MAEMETSTLAPAKGLTEREALELNTIRSRIEEISKEIKDGFEPIDSLFVGREKLLQDCQSEYREILKRLDTQDSDTIVPPEDLGLYFDTLTKEIGSVEEENTKIDQEIDCLMDTFATDARKIDSYLEEFDYLLKHFDSDGGQSSELNASQASSFQYPEFEILELDQQIEESQQRLKIMQELDNALKSVDLLAEASSMLSHIKVLEVKDNCLRLFLIGPVLTSDAILLGHKLDFGIEKPVNSDHELLLEFSEETMELKKMEIFPDDVPLNEIFEMIKSSRWDFHLADTSYFEYIVRLVQNQILLSTTRRLALKDANKSRHSFEYSDRDKMVTVHLVGGVDAFIEVPLNWPLSSAALALLSIKDSSSQSQNLTLPLVGHVKARANSLEHPRHHLVRFADAIEEILVHEMQSEV
ncbi:RNA-directed DNA polymerase (reverse transcriptase)-related family protein [Rhynchospora pubera]|uniref:RNA-directed DNA polymerase (Reverse transcriptase)-related family protein n=1 Tax=Rhynchospora pubera TaxID=906938 RepID=A0AAV8D7P9_9POAL|nr:RNA-directed DNA polymerase (reverse transcriptase)-related family protein [Rhynchospora pubera]